LDEPKKASAPKRTRNLDRIIRFVGYLLILLPAALGFLYVRAFGVSVVQRDAWSMVPLFDKWSAGTLQISDFFVQHFEHRSAFPEVAMLLLGIATKYDNVAEMYVIQGLPPRYVDSSLAGLQGQYQVFLGAFSFRSHFASHL